MVVRLKPEVERAIADLESFDPIREQKALSDLTDALDSAYAASALDDAFCRALNARHTIRDAVQRTSSERIGDDDLLDAHGRPLTITALTLHELRHGESKGVGQDLLMYDDAIGLRMSRLVDERRGVWDSEWDEPLEAEAFEELNEAFLDDLTRAFDAVMFDSIDERTAIVSTLAHRNGISLPWN